MAKHAAGTTSFPETATGDGVEHRWQSAEELARRISGLGPAEAADALEGIDDATVVDALQRVSPAVAGDILPELDEARRTSIFAAAPSNVTQQWSMNLSFDEDSIRAYAEQPTASGRVRTALPGSRSTRAGRAVGFQDHPEPLQPSSP